MCGIHEGHFRRMESIADEAVTPGKVYPVSSGEVNNRERTKTCQINNMVEAMVQVEQIC